MADNTIGILFLGGAKRVSMARHFKAAARARGLEARIYSYEMSADVPIALEGEVIIGRRWRDTDVVAHIIGVCRSRGISVVIPFVDGAVAVASEVAAAAGGDIFSPVSAAGLAELMFDKVRANDALADSGIPVPPTVDIEAPLTCPVIAKPRHGSASKGIVAIDSADDLRRLLDTADADGYLFQQRFDRRREITVDCYVSMLTGAIVCAVPRLRDEVAGGEVVRTTVAHNSEYETLARRVLAGQGLRGAVTVQLIEDSDTGRVYVMEINPRLGGGAVASVACGVDLPGFIIDESRGIAPADGPQWRDGVVCRYLDECVFPTK